jgi:hypothetical protein
MGTLGAVQGFLHPEGSYDDPHSRGLRRHLFPRLRWHFQFQNELLLFADLIHGEKYSVNVYGPEQPVGFSHVSNLYHPSTIETSLRHDGYGACGGLKDESDRWNIAGHKDRIIAVDMETLDLFARLYDDPGTPALEGRLPSIHARELVGVLRKFADYPRRLGDLDGQYLSTEMWHETNAVVDGTIRRETRFPRLAREWIVSGPHIAVSHPLFKTPRRICTDKSHYDPLDLTTLPADYLPRTNYVPACEPDIYVSRTPRVPWSDKAGVTQFFRFIARKMLSQPGERTLLPAIIPKGTGHIDGCTSLAFAKSHDLVLFCGSAASLLCDFFVKTTAKSNMREEVVRQFPMPAADARITSRCLLLNCLTVFYKELWNECWENTFASQRWSRSDPRLDNARFAALTSEWRCETPLRTDYERRQALVEIDVLAARALGLTLDELCTIYRIQFPVLRQNERDTWYDRRGRIVFTCSKSLPGVGFSRSEWERIKDMTSSVVTRTVQDDSLPGGPRERVIEYVAPFDRCDREADYATAWKFFDEADI